jgi:hypothetical protein
MGCFGSLAKFSLRAVWATTLQVIKRRAVCMEAERKVGSFIEPFNECDDH